MTKELKLSKWVLIGLMLLASSCLIPKKIRQKRKAARKLEQAKRLDPSLYDSITVVIHDTVVITNYSHDTTTKVIYHDSTIVVNNERVFLKYFYDTLRKEIYHEYECKADTVIIENEVKFEKINQPPKDFYYHLYEYWWLAIVIVLAIGIIYKQFK